MMTDNSETSVPKIVDFGLSKMLGPGQKAMEPFGTLGYVAPEILKAKPYNSSCDLWSLGCVIYAMMSACLPFNSSDDRKTKKLTIEAPLVFEEKVWKRFTQDSK